MMKAREIKRWLDTLPEEADVFVDEGGLTLVCHCGHGHTAYLEVGGDPDEGLLDDPGEQL